LSSPWKTEFHVAEDLSITFPQDGKAFRRPPRFTFRRAISGNPRVRRFKPVVDISGVRISGPRPAVKSPESFENRMIIN